MARILVIDDEANIRNMVGLALQQVGHSVDSAADGPEGIEKFRDGSSYDLVLLDQRMPEMEGLDVLKELRRRSPEARIVMITAYGTIDLAVDAMKAGATDFLRKPFTIETLRGAVQASLSAGDGQPAAKTAEPPRPSITYWAASINGYRIETKPKAATWQNGELTHLLRLTRPSGEVVDCTVVVPAQVVEQIRAYAETREAGCPERFWRHLCEHIAEEHLWQTPEIPGGNTFRIDGMSKELARWIDTLRPC